MSESYEDFAERRNKEQPIDADKLLRQAQENHSKWQLKQKRDIEDRNKRLEKSFEKGLGDFLTSNQSLSVCMRRAQSEHDSGRHFANYVMDRLAELLIDNLGEIDG